MNNDNNKQKKKDIKSIDFNRDTNSINQNIDNQSKRLEKSKVMTIEEIDNASYPAWQ